MFRALRDRVTSGKERREQLDAQSLLEQAILSGSVQDVEKSHALGADVTKPIDGCLPVCIAIQNGEDDVAISLLRLHPVDNLRLQPPPPSPPKNAALKHHFQMLMWKGTVIYLFMSSCCSILGMAPFGTRSWIARVCLWMLYDITKSRLQLHFDSFFGSHTGIDGAQIIEAYLRTSFQSERLMLELLGRGLLSNEYVSAALASPDYEDGRFVTGLWWAASLHGHNTALRRLVDLGVPVDLKFRLSVDMRLLQYECKYSLRRIHPHDAEHDDREWVFETALIMAAARGDVDSVGVLLELGADANAKDSLGRFPLQLACTEQHWRGFLGNQHTKRYLNSEEKGVQCTPYTRRWHKDPGSALIIYTFHRHGADVCLSRGPVGETVLHEAAWGGNPHIITAVLDLAPSLLYVRDDKQRLPLHYAARWYRATKMLLARRNGTEPLSDATETNDVGPCDAGKAGYANARDALGNTPLHHSAFNSTYNVKVAKIYLGLYEPADIEARNKAGKTVWDIAEDPSWARV
ncbi:hypothetical protein PG995_008607 [Apiospora arundinis]